MSTDRQSELAKRAREIVDRFEDPSAQDQLTKEMQRAGIIDERGQVLLPLNGEHRDTNSNDHPAKG